MNTDETLYMVWYMEVCHFEFNVKFGVFFGHLQESYFNKLLLDNSSDQLQFWAVQSKDLCNEKLC